MVMVVERMAEPQWQHIAGIDGALNRRERLLSLSVAHNIRI